MQVDLEQLQSAEQRLKEETSNLREVNARLELEKSETATEFSARMEESAALRETSARLESEKTSTTYQLDALTQRHESYVQQMESKTALMECQLKTITVSYLLPLNLVKGPDLCRVNTMTNCSE